jgi:sulfur-oxidizing protein SoxY
MNRATARSRRQFVQQSALLGVLAAAGVLTHGKARAQSAAPSAGQATSWNKAAFESKSMNDTLKALGGAGVAESKDIAINAPDIAENGAVVPVGVASKIANTQAVYILVDKNPNWLAASFNIPSGTEANVSTRIKMGQTSNVLALVKAGDKFFVASKEVKVTLGGCGG